MHGVLIHLVFDDSLADVERFSDALRRDQDEQAYLDAFVHSRTRYLPREIRAPLVSIEDVEIASGNSMLLESTGMLHLHALGYL